MKIGNGLDKLLKRLKITQAAAAEKLGIGKSRLNQYIKNTREPDGKMLSLICDTFSTTPNVLYDIDIPDFNKALFSEIFIAMDKWLQKNGFELESKDKIDLAFILYEEISLEPEEQRTTSIISFDDFLKQKIKKAS